MRSVGTILAVILGVAIISSEYSWGTIRTVLPRAGSRVRFLTAKYLVLVGFVLVLVLAGFLAALAGSLLVSVVVRANALPDDVAGDDLPSAWRGAGVLLIYLAAFVALAYQRFLSRDVTSSTE